MNKLPSFSHRSISVRQQREQTLPHLRRSASAYGSDPAASPVKIGTKGSIFSLVDRDITACSSDNVVDSAAKKTSNYVWLSRLWLMRRKANASQKRKPTGLKTVVETEQETKIPKWKRLLKKLKGGGAVSKGDGSIKNDGKTRVILRRDDTSSRDANIPPFPPLQTSSTPTSLIWERRSFAQITPLDLSHLYTVRIKKELAQLRQHN